MKSLQIKNSIYILPVFALLLTAQSAFSQLRPFGAIYFQNQYLANPAFAGIDKGVTLNAGYLRQWATVPGAPKAGYLTGAYQVNDKMGAGISIFNEEAGLFVQTRIAVTYGYHIVLNEERGRKLHLGLSAGFRKRRLDVDNINGDPNDPTLNNYNNKPLYADADFGVVFTEKRLTVQAVLPNMRMFFENIGDGEAGQPTFFTAVSYTFKPGASQSVGVEPKVCYRGVTGYNNLLDVGVNITFLGETLNTFIMYHSTRSASFGAGLKVASKFRLTGTYLTGAKGMGIYSRDNFEFGLQVLLNNEK